MANRSVSILPLSSIRLKVRIPSTLAPTANSCSIATWERIASWSASDSGASARGSAFGSGTTSLIEEPAVRLRSARASILARWLAAESARSVLILAMKFSPQKNFLEILGLGDYKRGASYLLWSYPIPIGSASARGRFGLCCVGGGALLRANPFINARDGVDDIAADLGNRRTFSILRPADQSHFAIGAPAQALAELFRQLLSWNVVGSDAARCRCGLVDFHRSIALASLTLATDLRSLRRRARKKTVQQIRDLLH